MIKNNVSNYVLNYVKKINTIYQPNKSFSRLHFIIKVPKCLLVSGDKK